MCDYDSWLRRPYEEPEEDLANYDDWFDEMIDLMYDLEYDRMHDIRED